MAIWITDHHVYSAGRVNGSVASSTQVQLETAPDSASTCVRTLRSNPPRVLRMPGQPTELQNDFTFVALAPNECLQDRFVKLCLTKWGMFDGTILGCFSFVKPYHKLQGIELLQDLFNSHAVQRMLQEKVAVKGDNASCELETQGPQIITFEPVLATVTSMSLFDRLTEQGIARKNGMITKCMEDYIDGFQVSDKLRDLLLNPESSSADIYTPDERQELLFCIFEHLCLGGAVNQFEDDITAYLQASKMIYKSLVSVHKSSSTKQVEVASAVYRVTAISLGQLFPHKGHNNFCYVSIDTHKKQCRLLYHAVEPLW